MSDQLDQVVESDQPEQLGTGFVFTEGPVWHPDGYWLFVDLFREPAIICRLRAGEQVETIREPSGMTNGMALDLQGRLVMCEMDTRQITRLEPDGAFWSWQTNGKGSGYTDPTTLLAVPTAVFTFFALTRQSGK